MLEYKKSVCSNGKEPTLKVYSNKNNSTYYMRSACVCACVCAYIYAGTHAREHTHTRKHAHALSSVFVVVVFFSNKQRENCYCKEIMTTPKISEHTSIILISLHIHF